MGLPETPPDGDHEKLSAIVRALLDSLDEGIVIVDARGGTVYLNAAARATQSQMARGGRVVPLRLGARLLGELIIVSEGPGRTWADRERVAIRQVLQQTGGKRAEAARRLGISRTTLWRRLTAERS